MPSDTAASPHRIERALVAAAATVIGLSLLAIVAVLVAAAASADLGQGGWQTIRLIPLIGFPIGVLLIIVLMVTTGVRRSRESRDAGR